MIRLISFVPLEKEMFVLFDGNVPVSLLVPGMAVLLYFGEIAAALVYKKYRDLLRDRELYVAKEQQLYAMKRRLSEAEEFYGGIRKVRHEMRNHLANIRALADADEHSAAEDYIEKLEKSVSELDFKYETGNAVTDVIINDRAKRAETYDIKFDTEWLCRNYGDIDIFDIGIVLSNILDNAITACMNVTVERRYIRLSVRRKRNFLVITVENSCEREPIFGPNGLPVTTKPTPPDFLAEHGIGLCNVREIAERYFGTMDIKVENKIFTITVMMQG